MKLTYTSVFSYLRVAVAGTLVLAAVALAVTSTKMSTPLQQAAKPAYTPKKVDADFFKPGRSAETAVVAEAKNPNSSPEIEAYLRRAFPANEVSGDATLSAKAGWASLNAGAHAAGSWQLIGPSKATYPAVLDPFLFDGAQYVASGRVTGLAIAPNCSKQSCVLYVAAAGGGVWRTDKALNGANWQFMSGSFGINAIGSLLMDPSDPSGNTLYAATGEANAAVDSEAGVGIYKTTDGGNTWALVPGSDIFFQRGIGEMDFDKDGKLLVPIASSVRGINSEDSGPISSGATGHPLATRGLYRCDGVSCTLIRAVVAVATVRGSTTVKADPTHPGVIYVNEYSRGIWRSTDNGATWPTNIKPALNPARNTDRAEFSVTTLANGNTRMYVGVGNQTDSGANRARFYRTDDASGAAAFTDMTTPQNIGYCTAQCWYDNRIYTPKGSPDVVYVGGSFDYNNLHGRDNGRAWILSTDGGATFSDLTQDGDPHHAEAIHPDQHAITTVPGNPFQFIIGSDGGVQRSDGNFANVAYKCDSRGLTPADTAFCKSMLYRVPNQLIDLNDGLSTLQFQSLSISAQRPQNLLQGGTQDNGTFQYNGSAIVWPQIIYGDGGQSGFMVTNDKIRFNTFSGQAHDANFKDGDPVKWVIISAPILSSPDASYFYPPIIADPNAAAAGTIYEGSQHVWRTQDWGGNQASLEANCPEFTTSAVQPGCGDFMALGGPVTGSGSDAGDLTGTFYGVDARLGGAVASVARTPQNTSTLWAATGVGRLFVSDNADIANPLSVVWNRLDNSAANSPTRAINAVYVDPTNVAHTFVAYSGYNVNTPAQPGHVFDVVRTGPMTATFTDISFNLPDFPITDVTRDEVTGDLYAASDFGVMKLPFGTTAWVVAGSGLPMVECPGLTINSAARILYVATHGRSAWSMQLP